MAAEARPVSSPPGPIWSAKDNPMKVAQPIAKAMKAEGVDTQRHPEDRCRADRR